MNDINIEEKCTMFTGLWHLQTFHCITVNYSYTLTMLFTDLICLLAMKWILQWVRVSDTRTTNGTVTIRT